MINKNMGKMICLLRKEKGMTQSDLAEKMNVTDKAVSKWERNCSCPDIHSIPKLAEVLDTTVEELLNAQIKREHNQADEMMNFIFIGVGLAMGICITVLSVFKKIEVDHALTMLGIGISCFGVYLLKNKKDKP